MIWTHPGEAGMYIGIGALIGIIIAGIAQDMQARYERKHPPKE